MPRNKKASINAYDAYALIEQEKLYPEQLSDVLISELEAEKILCISDTTDVLINSDDVTDSLALSLEKAKLGPRLELYQTDFQDFHYLEQNTKKWGAAKFGAHLPQSELESRREYIKINSTALEEHLSPFKKVDVVLGRKCICACSGILCGGIEPSIIAQEYYLKEFIELEPKLAVFTASAKIFDEDSEQLKAKEAQLLYQEAKANMIKACDNLNELKDSPYRLALIEADMNLDLFLTQPDPKNENGYMVVIYDTRKVDFQLDTTSLQKKRQQEKIEAIYSQVSKSALIEQHKKIIEKNYPKKNPLQTRYPIKLNRVF